MAGFTQSVWISLPVGIVLTIVFLVVMKNREAKKAEAKVTPKAKATEVKKPATKPVAKTSKAKTTAKPPAKKSAKKEDK